MIIQGNSLEKLKDLESESVDAIVSDPPYELGFMGKKWDNSGIAYNIDLWKECLRVLKPGGHLLAFGGTRTYHRMAVAIEDAGFEVRDMLEWIYASGFPKSLNVGKAVDKLQGNERVEVGRTVRGNAPSMMGKSDPNSPNYDGTTFGVGTTIHTKGNSEWEGFGTALKPAHEPIVMARKPLSEKTIVENVLKHGTGAIDIDGCRIPTSESTERLVNTAGHFSSEQIEQRTNGGSEQGRFPANIICTDDALNDGVMTKSLAGGKSTGINFGGQSEKYMDRTGHNDSGSKSRYFDIDVWAEKHGLLQFPKASKRERNEGCEGLEAIELRGGGGRANDGYDENDPEQKRLKDAAQAFGAVKAKKSNFHPTVKPVHLMSWLVRLVSKEGDTVLDPFMGSGTTGVACKRLGREFIGIELSEEYIKIAEARINGTESQQTLI